MKGLLLKDFYMAKKYCKMILVCIIVFAGVSVAEPSNLFYQFYPVVMASILPVTILGYDEKCHWNIYGQIFPYSRKQFVSVKYLMSLFYVCGMWLLLAAVQIVGMLVNERGAQDNFLFFFFLVLSSGILSSGILLPVIFKFGTEKGRLAYLVIIALICGGGAASMSTDISLYIPVSANVLSLLILTGSVAVFFLSWLLSMKIYEKREL